MRYLLLSLLKSHGSNTSILTTLALFRPSRRDQSRIQWKPNVPVPFGLPLPASNTPSTGSQGKVSCPWNLQGGGPAMARNLNSRCPRPRTRDPGSSGGGRPAADFGPELSIFRLVPSPNSQALPLAVRCGAHLGPDHPVTASFAESLSAILGLWGTWDRSTSRLITYFSSLALLYAKNCNCR